MKTITYNPSDLEIELASVILELKDQISTKLKSNKVEDIQIFSDKDNPDLLFKLIDTDGDKHELVVKFIQRADQ